MSPTRMIPSALTILLGFVTLAPASAWTPEMHAEIARQAATIAPPDLFRQIKRHEKAFAAGLSASIGGRGHSDSGAALLSRLESGSEAIIGAIEAHRPFREIVHELGRLTVYAAEANNPLKHSSDDPQEERYRMDYETYAASAFPRFAVIFYGQGRDVRTETALDHLLSETGRRGSELYPLIGLEYRRIGAIDGIGQFDDKSTAFGVGSIAFSHAVSDLAAIYRYVWLSAGGADRRELPITLPTALSETAEAPPPRTGARGR
ncbi:MAG: hypothetical protein GY769_13065 [bacterium]|nr:hypothetical protein [bacterium]